MNQVSSDLLLGHCVFQALGDSCARAYILLSDVQQADLQVCLGILVRDAGEGQILF